MKLIILRGLPGSGKTTFAKMLADNIPGAIAIASDDFFMEDGVYKFDLAKLHRVHQLCQEAVKSAMINKQSYIILHNTNTTEKEMRPYFDMAEENGYNVTTLIVENRHGSANVHSVPEETLEKMENRFNVKLI